MSNYGYSLNISKSTWLPFSGCLKCESIYYYRHKKNNKYQLANIAKMQIVSAQHCSVSYKHFQNNNHGKIKVMRLLFFASFIFYLFCLVLLHRRRKRRRGGRQTDLLPNISLVVGQS